MSPEESERRAAGYPAGDIDVDYHTYDREPASPSRFGPDYEPENEEWR